MLTANESTFNARCQPDSVPSSYSSYHNNHLKKIFVGCVIVNLLLWFLKLLKLAFIFSVSVFYT